MIAWIVSLILLIIVILFLSTLRPPRILEVKVTSIESITALGFKIGGHILLDNRNRIGVIITGVDYGIYLHHSEIPLGPGHIDGVYIKPRSQTRLEFHQTVEWIPTAELALELVRNGDTHVDIKGHVEVKTPIKTFHLPFKETHDMKPYIQRFVTSSIQGIVEEVVETIKRRDGLIDRIKKLLRE